MSNWFSSLRRPQKNKKLNQDAKKLQKSCIDLTSNSTFYTDLPIVTSKYDQKNNCQNESYIPRSSSPTPNSYRKLKNEKQQKNSMQLHIVNNALNSFDSTSNFSTTSDSDTSSIISDRKSLLSGRNVRNLCSKCCCNFQKPTTGIFIVKNQAGNNTELKIETDRITDVRVTKLPMKEGNKIIYNKRCETKRTTTTTVTRTTTLLTNRAGLIFDENGDLITHHFRQIRASSLGSILDERQDENLNTTEIIINKYGDNCDVRSEIIVEPKIYSTSCKSSPLLECNDFEFIDESSSDNINNNSNDIQLSNNLYNNGTSTSCNKNNLIICDSDTTDLCMICKSPLKGDDNSQVSKFPLYGNSIIKNNNNNNKKIYSYDNYGKQIKDELCEVVSEMETLDSQEGCKHSNKDKQMSIGRKKFNMDPKKGIEYLVDNHLLRMDPQDVAHFLYKGEGLNKTAIGDYLGEKNDFNEQVLKAFVELHDFTNLILVQALRQFLWSFRLPGEAQKIDRMMECFAQRYCQLNPDIFTNTDTCYVLSFAIIMLNTSLHNPSVKDKPTVEQFIQMNRGINNGGDLPRSLLESLYESIRTEPFKIPQDDGNDLMHTFFNPDKEGWLWKQGGRYKSWKRRWFILNDNCLYYFEYTTDKEPRGIIPLENISVREIQDRSKPHCFELYASGGADIIKACKTDSEGKVVEGKHTVYRMSAATEEDKLEWIKRLNQSISHNPFYDILVQRKKKALAKS